MQCTYLAHTYASTTSGHMETEVSFSLTYSVQFFFRVCVYIGSCYSWTACLKLVICSALLSYVWFFLRQTFPREAVRFGNTSPRQRVSYLQVNAFEPKKNLSVKINMQFFECFFFFPKSLF